MAWIVLGTAALGALAVAVLVWRRRRREDPLTKGRRALRGIRRDSQWLKTRPFSDQYDDGGWR